MMMRPIYKIICACRQIRLLLTILIAAFLPAAVTPAVIAQDAGDRTTYWDHNGSKMIMHELSSDTLGIAYHTPKSSLRDVVQAGTILVRLYGRSGGVTGTAKVFKSGCTFAPYNVKGRFSDDGKTLVLEGPAPVWSGCTVTGYSDRSSNARLVFSRLENGAPSPAAQTASASGNRYNGRARLIALPNPILSSLIAVIQPSLPCNFRIEGVITKGLFEKVAAKMTSGRDLVCLDSPGGSFAEAVKIGKYFRSKPVATKIEAGARCESACALMFMAGQFNYFEGGAYSWRVLHPLGRLGFHAPSLQLRDGQYTEEAVATAYALAADNIASVIFDIMLAKRDINEDTRAAMKSSLLAHMISTPPDRMFYIDTIDKVGRWDIELHPHREVTPNGDHSYVYACFSGLSWAGDLSAIGSADRFLRSRGGGISKNDDHITISINEMFGIGCSYQIGAVQSPNKRPASVLQPTFVGEAYRKLKPWHYLAPETPITSLAP